MLPTLVENSKILKYLFVNFFFVNNIIMIGEPMHTTFEMVPCAPAISSEK